MKKQIESKYFEKRAEKRMEDAHRKANRPVAKISRAYKRSKGRLEDDIKRILGNVDKLDNTLRKEHLRTFINNEEYQRTLIAYQTTTDPIVKARLQRLLKENAAAYRIRRKEAMIEAIEREKLLMTDTILNNTKDHLRETYKGIMKDLGMNRPNTKRIEQVLKEEWSGTNYSKRIWHNQEVLGKQIEKEMFDQFLSGKSYREMNKSLDDLSNVGLHVCDRLVRTETSYVVNTAELDDSKRRGILAKKFEATLDKRTSKMCRDHDQRIILIDKIKIGVNAPPLHPYCRSHLSDMLEGWDYDSEDELMRMIEGRKADLKGKLNNKILESFNPADVSEQDYIDFSNDCKKMCTSEELKLINRHPKPNGGTGGYFQTPNSFNINEALRTNNFSILDSDDINVINTLKKVVTRIDTKNDYLLHRFDNYDSLSDYFTESLDELAKIKQPLNRDISINKMLSTSMIEDYNLFTNRPVKWEIKAPRGSKIFANGFLMESEALIVKNSKIRVLNVLSRNGKIIIEALLL